MRCAAIYANMGHNSPVAAELEGSGAATTLPFGLAPRGSSGISVSAWGGGGAVIWFYGS